MTKRVRMYVVWGVFVGLAVGIFVLQSLEEPTVSIPPEEQRRMFPFREPDVGQIDLMYRGQLISLMRSSGGLWFMHDASHRHVLDPAAANGGATNPAGAPAGAATPAAANGAGADQPHPEPDAEQAAELAKAIDFLTRMIYDRRISPTQPLDEYGLKNPQIVMIFYPRNPDNSAGSAPIGMFYVGAPLSHKQSYYAQLDGDRDIALIPLYQVNTLTELTVGEVAQASAGPLELNPTNR